MKTETILKILNNKIERIQAKLVELEPLISNNATSLQKQEYIQLKSKKEAYQDVIDWLI